MTVSVELFDVPQQRARLAWDRNGKVSAALLNRLQLIDLLQGAEDDDMAAMNISHCTSGGSEENLAAGFKSIRDMLGPQAVDQAIRSAISQCWMMMPPDRRHAAAVEAEIRRIVDRALRDLQEDAQAFGMMGDSSTGGTHS